MRKMKRRQFLKAAALGAGSIVLARYAWTRPSPLDRPNVLFIAIDDLNDWTGCLGGHPDARTPNIDRLAQRGVLFTRTYCAAPACNPSRTALLTGIRPSTSGVYHNSQPWRPVLKDAVTLPQHFMAHGYRVVGGGKIFHGAYPDPPSWHEYFPSKTETKPPDPMPPNPPLNGIPKTGHFDWGPIDVDDEDMGDWKVSQWAIGELQKDHKKPFFLGVGFFRPHLPWYVPRKYFEMFPSEKVTLPNVKEDDLDDIPPLGREMARTNDHKKVIQTHNWRKAVAAYLACGAFVDRCVGRVLDALEKSPYAKNTIVVLWSDHGWHLGEKLHWRKFALWEEATHNVLAMIVPGVTKPGGRCPRPVNLLDIYPTLIELCDLKPKKELEGISLVRWLKDPTAPKERPAVTTHGRENHSVRSERWRYIRYRDGTEELYDHEKDELEWYNLANKPEYAEVKRELARWLPKVNAPDAPRASRKKRA